MGANKIDLEIITPDGLFYKGKVDSCILYTTEGYLGVLYEHEPITAILDIGKVTIKIDDKNVKTAAIFGGFIKVFPESTTVLTDLAEWPENIDIERAKKAKERAEKRLSSASIDIDRAQIALKKALLRIDLHSGNN